MKIITCAKKKARIASSAGSAQAKRRNKGNQNALKRLWYYITHWSHQRPCWGAFCVLLASVLILWAPLCLLQSSIVPASTLWAGLLVGGLLLAMGLIELFAPAHALVAGAIGLVLSLISLITVLGGFGIGMLLGVIGSSYAIAWKPEKKTGSRPIFWSVFGFSIAIVSGMMVLITRGTLAIAAPVVGPYTTTTGRIECHNIHAVPAISQVDHRTVVNLSHSGYCVSSNIVITQHALGKTFTITQASAIARGITSETVASHTALEKATNATLSAANGLESDIDVDISTDVTAQVMYSNSESITATDVSFSIS